ncbi:OmpH family outer membrane protein [Nonlabens ponticola]|uniref:OmpH family outer membrane protein n=1 Tax=Nonlabens ponticola TaxID=2496866 RepID=A0A3S9MV02_9FLAO|nr:OmpH family outer membrane protein [Nonlabens ponticola]AZQ42998.1 OmpH family outer membrane protein [Nonlabens ponticola]
MKCNIIVLLIVVLVGSAFAKAQRGIRVGYVDMEYILENVPEYQKASTQLENKMQVWKQEIEKMEAEIDQMETSLKNERVLLTKELIEEREEEIEIKRQDMRDYQVKRFGTDGDFIKQKQQLIQPVQDQVFNEMQKIGQGKKYDMIVDRSETTLLYSADRHDLSDDVLKAIGRTTKLEVNAAKRKSRNRGNDEDSDLVSEQPYKSVQEAADDAAIEQEKQEIRDERQATREEKTRKRDSIKAARKREYQERRQRLLDARQRKKDSIKAVRAGKVFVPKVEENVENTAAEEKKPSTESGVKPKVTNPTVTTPAAALPPTPETKKPAAANKPTREELIKKRDSIKAAKIKEVKERRERILEERKRKRDSILNARKKAKENKESESKKGTPPGGN